MRIDTSTTAPATTPSPAGGGSVDSGGASTSTTAPATTPSPAPILTTTNKVNTSDFFGYVGTWDHTPMPFNPHVFTQKHMKSAYTFYILYWVHYGSPCHGQTYTHDSCAGIWRTASGGAWATLITDPKHPDHGAGFNYFAVPYTAANRYAGSYDGGQGIIFSWRPDAAATVGAVLSTVICVCLCICTRTHTHTHTHTNTHSNGSTTASIGPHVVCACLDGAM